MAYIGKEPGSGLRGRFVYTATAGQTSFTGSDSLGRTLTYTDSEYTDVFLNGVKLDKTDYTATSGTSIVLDSGASADDTLEILAFDTFGLFSGEFSQDVSVGGDLTISDKIIHSGDTNTAIRFADADTVTVETGGSERMRVTSGGNIQIGSTNSGVAGSLDVSIGSTSSTGGITLFSPTDGTHSIGFADGTSGTDRYRGYVEYKHANDALCFATQSSERMRITSDGDLLLGTTSGTNRLTVAENQSGGYAASFHNDGNNVDRYGLLIFNGTDDNSGTNAHIQFADGDATGVGLISSSGGTVTYGAFTAMHPCVLPDADNDDGYPYGTLLETISLSYTQKNDADTERGLIYNVRKTQSANSKAVLGAYGSSMNDLPDETNKHQALVLGDGHILCNNSGGNISVGDGICSSAAAGIGQKATANPSMIIGIAQEDVTFANDTETKLVAVQYGLQQFIPWS